MPELELSAGRIDALSTWNRPALVIWAPEDRMMPPDHGPRLVEVLPNARLVEVGDSYPLIPEDQPAGLAAHLREFVPAARFVTRRS